MADAPPRPAPTARRRAGYAPPVSDPRPAAPGSILDLAAAGAEYVQRAIGVEVDYGPDTLPLVDHYARSLPSDAKPEVLALVVPALGAYFGEVVRRTLGGCRWHVGDDDHLTTRLEFEGSFLHFSPMGMALEAVLRREVAGSGAHLGLLDEDRRAVAEALERTGPVRDDDYWRLAVRYEVIEQVLSVLEARALGRGESGRTYGPEVYRSALDTDDDADDRGLPN